MCEGMLNGQGGTLLRGKNRRMLTKVRNWQDVMAVVVEVMGRVVVDQDRAEEIASGSTADEGDGNVIVLIPITWFEGTVRHQQSDSVATGHALLSAQPIKSVHLVFWE